MRRRCKCGTRARSHIVTIRYGNARIYCLSCGRRITLTRILSHRRWLLRVLR